MGAPIELIRDAEGVIVTGEAQAVERFLRESRLARSARTIDLRKLSTLLRHGAESATTVSVVMEQSARYLKLTPESAQALKDAGGLMKTKTDGISHVMLGEPGHVGKWLQAEDGPASLLTNPAALSGIAGLMTQAAQQAEASELRTLLVQIDRKLDDIRRQQRDAVLVGVSSAAAAIDEARVLRESGGDPQTLWEKVSGMSTMITTVQEGALRSLGAAADKAAEASKMKDVKRAALELDQEVALQLAIISRCFELQDEFEVLELDHVLATAPERFEGHSLGKAKMRSTRRAVVLAETERLLQQMDAVGAVATANIVLHAQAARIVVCSLDQSAAALDEFTAPFGVKTARGERRLPAWREAIRDRESLRRAGAEVGQKATVGALGIGGLAATMWVAKGATTDDS